MRGTSRMVVAAIAGSTLAACAAIEGLDGITEDDCAPNGCPDVVVSPEGGHDAVATEAGGQPEASAGDGATGADTAAADVRRDAPIDPPDATEGGAETGVEGGADGGVDAGTDATADARSDAEAGPSDAASDVQPLADAAPDSPCGTVYIHETFDGTSAGWTLDSTWSIAATCASPPAPQKGHPDPTVDHTTSTAGGVAAAYACGNNPTGTTAPARYATSPAVDVSAAPSLKLAFYRWLNTDAAGWMTSTVDVFDGTAWVNVYTNPSGAGNIVADAAWTRVEYDVSAYKNAAFRVRFGYAVTSTGVYAMSCWNVDDLTLSTASCP
jgi:hypothetical protein